VRAVAGRSSDLAPWQRSSRCNARAKTLPEYQRTYFEWAAEKTLERDQKHTQRE
jgi:hypothetical protein